MAAGSVFAAADDVKPARPVLPQPAAVTKPKHPGSYEAGGGTLQEVKNSPHWEGGGTEGTPAAPAGRGAFVLGNDDAAATLADSVYAGDAARLIDFPCFPSNYHCCRENTAEKSGHVQLCHFCKRWKAACHTKTCERIKDVTCRQV